MNTNTENLSLALKDLQVLLTYFEKLSQLESIDIDLALSKTKEIYNTLLLLKIKNEDASLLKVLSKEKNEFNAEQTEKKVETIFKEVIKEIKINEKPAQMESETDSIMELEEEAPVKEEIKESPKIGEVTISKKEITTEIKAKTSEGDIIAEKYQRNEPLINEILARAGKRDLSSMLQTKPVKNIESAIGINERFEFVKELFNGDNATYLKTIHILDNVSNFNEAFNYINQTFSWDYESETVHKLLDLVRRRYITD